MTSEEERRIKWYNDRIGELERQVQNLQRDLSVTDAAHGLANAHLEIILEEGIEIASKVTACCHICTTCASCDFLKWLPKAKKVLGK